MSDFISRNSCNSLGIACVSAGDDNACERNLLSRHPAFGNGKAMPARHAIKRRFWRTEYLAAALVG